MGKIKFDLANTDLLFGHENAELEDIGVFLSYAVEPEEMQSFFDVNKKMRIALAYKGEGKSGLFHLVGSKAKGLNQLSLSMSAYKISPNLAHHNFDEWTREWKKNIYGSIAKEIGATIKHAFTDDAMTLLEEAERSNYKERSFVKSVLDRVKYKEVEFTSPNATGHDKILQRYLKETTPFWLLLDDIDNNFDGTKINSTKIAAFFAACISITQELQEIRLRLSLRPNVWAMISREFDTSSHIRPHLLELSWSEDDYRRILAKRVESYIKRTGQEKHITDLLCNRNTIARERAIIGLLFTETVYWKKEEKSIHVPLYTLSMHRPRWVIELCKKAATFAKQNNRSHIDLDCIIKQLKDFGTERIVDTTAEFKTRCTDLDKIIYSFHGQHTQLKTDTLKKIVKNRVLSHLNPTIPNKGTDSEDTEICKILYEVGFVFGRRNLGVNDSGKVKYEHIYYKSNPTLFSPGTPLNQNVSWEIHPVFREVLNLVQTDTPQ